MHPSSVYDDHFLPLSVMNSVAKYVWETWCDIAYIYIWYSIATKEVNATVCRHYSKWMHNTHKAAIVPLLSTMHPQ